MTDPKEGWGRPLEAWKDHYFVDHVSLCSRWMFGGKLTQDDGEPGPADCVMCRRRYIKRAAKVKA